MFFTLLNLMAKDNIPKKNNNRETKKVNTTHFSEKLTVTSKILRPNFKNSVYQHFYSCTIFHLYLLIYNKHTQVLFTLIYLTKHIVLTTYLAALSKIGINDVSVSIRLTSRARALGRASCGFTCSGSCSLLTVKRLA